MTLMIRRTKFFLFLFFFSIAHHFFPKNSAEEDGPLSWSDFFGQSLQVATESGLFQVYQSLPSCAGAEGDAHQVCSSFGTSEVAMAFVPPQRTDTVYFLIHGAGHTSLSWSMVADRLRMHSRVVAMDLRGHGLTSTSDDADLSLDRLALDCAGVLRALFKVACGGGEHSEVGWPSIIAVGHSMGAAVATRVSAANLVPLSGLVAIDLVEGTAISAIPKSRAFIASRPVAFASERAAIRWAISAGMPKRLQAARVSIPAQLLPTKDHEGSSLPSGALFRWRCDLMATERFWLDWYQGMSESFLNSKARKLLILAGTDRLDKPLMIGQMQGRFQVVILPESGHCAHEDQPELTADHLFQFKLRYGI